MEMSNHIYGYEFLSGSETGRKPMSSLVGSRIVLEFTDHVTTGTVTYIEGDIIEVELPKAQGYQLGSPVRVTIYMLGGGIRTFISSVIAKDVQTLAVFNHPSIREMFNDTRKHVRVTCNHQLTVVSGLHKMTGAPVVKTPIKADLVDLSLGGLCLALDPTKVLNPDIGVLDCYLELDDRIQCRVVVLRSTLKNNKALIAGKFAYFPKKKENSLRAFIIRSQVKQRSRSKTSNGIH